MLGEELMAKMPFHSIEAAEHHANRLLALLNYDMIYLRDVFNSMVSDESRYSVTTK